MSYTKRIEVNDIEVSLGIVLGSTPTKALADQVRGEVMPWSLAGVIADAILQEAGSNPRRSHEIGLTWKWPTAQAPNPAVDAEIRRAMRLFMGLASDEEIAKDRADYATMSAMMRLAGGL